MQVNSYYNAVSFFESEFLESDVDLLATPGSEYEKVPQRYLKESGAVWPVIQEHPTSAL